MKGAKRGNEIREKADINTAILHKNFHTIENIYFRTIVLYLKIQNIFVHFHWTNIISYL